MSERDSTFWEGAQPLDFVEASRSVLHLASRGPGRIEFLRDVSHFLLRFARCDAMEIRTGLGQLHHRYRWTASKLSVDSFHFEPIDPDDEIQRNESTEPSTSRNTGWLADILDGVLRGRFDRPSRRVTAHGSVWTPDAEEDFAVRGGPPNTSQPGSLVVRSFAVIPFDINPTSPGVLALLAGRKFIFTAENIQFYEALAQTLGLAIDDRRAQHALRERVKELTCLYAVAQVLEDEDAPISALLSKIVEQIAPAWQFPEAIAARIQLDGETYSTGDAALILHRLEAPIRIDGLIRGVVEVGYVSDRTEFTEGPFLKEERHLIDAIAREIALFAQRRAAREEKERLAEQVRQADRLATIGQLAAGLAHEINEPLGAILGFAQLAQKASDVSGSVRDDLEKIVKAALHGRTIVRKLMLFARQSPPLRSSVRINAVVEDSLALLATRIAENRVHVSPELDAADPVLFADVVQMHQMIVNLCVNGLQAMPDGGRLTIRTRRRDDAISIDVEDTGTGIAPEIADRVFDPFFTTKDVEHGTGLGLSVVHGIVTAHGGKIRFESATETGTCFRVTLPASPPADSTVE